MFPPLVINKIIHPLRCRLIRWHKDIAAVTSEIKKTEHSSLDELYALQEKKLRLLCNNATSGSMFYKNIFNYAGINPEKISIDQLVKLPILDKTIIRDNYDNIINQHYPKDQINQNATGGSSGEPLIFCKSRYSDIFAAALLLRGFDYCGMKKGYPYVKLWGAPTDVQHATKDLKSRMWNYLYNLRTIDAFKVSYDLFEKEYFNFIKNPPFILESYSNILYEFACYLQLKDKKPLSLPSVISSAGVLYDFQRKTIQETISKNVFNRYGSREFGNIAQECSSHTGLHINMERFIVEIDKSEQENFGDILVTDLENHAFPFIRYKIGDIGEMTENTCDCGRKSLMFKKVVGRSLDIIKLPSGLLISGAMFPHFFKDYSKIILGQVIQDKYDHLEIRLKMRTDSTISDIQPLIQKIRDATQNEMKVTVNINKNFITNPTGKYRPVISNI